MACHAMVDSSYLKPPFVVVLNLHNGFGPLDLLAADRTPER